MAYPPDNHVRTTEECQVRTVQAVQPSRKDSEKSIEVLEISLYTFREVQISLAKYKGNLIPPTTLRRWIVQMGIEPDEFGCYSQEDITVLARLAFWLKRGKTVQSFAKIIQKELTTHGN
jgi:hypothetical protein